jgi:molecular chaperone GrpE
VAGSNHDEKSSFQTDISQDVIDAALKSVERHRKRGAPAEEEAAPESEESAEVAGSEETEAAAPEGVDLEVEAPPSPALAELEAALAASRKELEEARAQLEFSQAKGREMMERLKEEHERALRATADLENYRKRAQKEKEEVQRFGIERLLKDFLPVLDNLDRALEAARQSSDFEGFRTGVGMTRKLFEDTLGRHGVKGFSAAGQPFDPRLHEAMQQVETTQVPPGHVAQEVLRGYTLNERLVRPALVMVARAPAPAAPEGESNTPPTGSQ